MKAILIKDVPGMGRRGEVKNVADGYATNFLFPNKLAVPATADAVKRMEMDRMANETEKRIQQDLLDKNLAELKGKTLTIKAKAGEAGHLFAGIHKEELIKRLKAEFHLDIPVDLLELEHPIKSVGSHTIKVGKAEFELLVETE
jgi:large subunit ribosomal protein L9